MQIKFASVFVYFQSECHTYLSTLKNVYHTAAKVLQNDTKKVEIVEIQDEKVTTEVNGSQSDCKTKTDTRWSDSKSSVKNKDTTDTDKEKKCDIKVPIKKELVDLDKEKK